MKFNLETRMFSEIGWSRNLPAFVKEIGWQDVVVFIDKALMQTSDYANEIVPQFNATVIELNCAREPTYEYLQQLAEEIRFFKKWDGSVIIGGGSAMDLGKALSALRNNWLPAIEYRGWDKLTKPQVPSICVPTTAGTGSEVTFNAVFTDTYEKKKLGINGRYMNAQYAILDAQWCMSAPLSVQVSAGMDALVHCLESWMAKGHTQISRAFSREAFRLLYNNLPHLSNVFHPKAHQELLLAAFFAGAALYNSGSGIAGALSYPLGVHYGIPHGIAGGIFIADVVQWNVDHGYWDFPELMQTLDPGHGWGADQYAAEDFAKQIRELSDTLGVPRFERPWPSKITLDQLDLPSLQSAFDQNPVKFTVKDAQEMLSKRIKHE